MHNNRIMFNKEDVIKFYNFFKHSKPTEIRVFDAVKYPNGQSVFVSTEDEFIKKCKYYCEEEEVSVYIGARDRKAKGDKNVISSSFVFFEIDEHEHGANKESEKEKIITFLKEKGIEVGMQGMSGGGWHFYIPHKLQEFESEEKALEYKEQSLNSFKRVFQDNGFDVDGAVFNLERVTRVLGTFNFKRDKISEIELIEKVDIEKNTKNLICMIQNYISKNNTEDIKYNVDDDELIKQIKEKWVDGDRNNLALSVAGYLRKERKLGLTTSLQIIEKICDDCGDNFNERKAAVKETYKKDEKDIKGIKGLVERNVNVDYNNLPMIRIGGSGLLVSEVAEEIASVFSKHETLFYKQEIREIVEVSKIKHDEEDKSFMGFSVIQPKRFITLSEKYFVPFVYTIKKSDNEDEKPEMVRTPKSLTNDRANIILASPHFQETMPIIKRIFSVPMPMMYDGKLTFPKIKYDKRFYSWLNPNAPKVDMDNMNIDKAKELIEKIFKEFCFEKEQDYTNAIAGLITPFIRGIFPDFTTRTPMFFYVANRERAGKDYLAGITGLTLEGVALDEPPISDGESGGSKNDELRKKVFACVLQGRRRLHFANNKGRMNNSVLEAMLTTKTISDRILGKTEVVAVDNELDFSSSGNVGITFTPDLSNRCVFVKLFLDIENANERKFNTPNLHGWIMENRGEVLSAIFCLIEDWVKNGSKPGSKNFASYPEWAQTCGGIMENAGFGSPCIPNDEALTVGGDTESQEMKQLFETAYEKYPEEAIPKSFIIDLIKTDGSMFTYMDWEKKSDQGSFGKKLVKFYGRVFSNVRLSVVNPSDRTARHKLLFTKQKIPEHFQVGKVGKFGKELRSLQLKKSTENNTIDNYKTKSVSISSVPFQPYQESKIPSQIGQKVGKVISEMPKTDHDSCKKTQETEVKND